MSRLIRNIKSRFTMTFKYAMFRDVIDGRMVNLYTDCYGVEWMSHSKWDLFRVKRVGGQDEN